jgi:clan AA aspartic protease
MEKIKLTNSYDEDRVKSGECRPEQVRTIEIEALVDTGATMLVLPADVVACLGMKEQGRRKVAYANGQEEEVPWIGGVRLKLLGREMVASALVVPAGTTALIGQIPLAELDLVVDPKSRELRVNPASPDMPRLDILLAA